MLVGKFLVWKIFRNLILPPIRILKSRIQILTLLTQSWNTLYIYSEINWILTVGSRYDQPQFSRDNDTRNRLFVSRKRGSGCWHVTFTYNGLCSGIPMPQKYGAIGRTRSYVAIGSDVAFGPRKTSDYAVMSEYDLHYFGSFCWKDSKTVVPKSTRH